MSDVQEAVDQAIEALNGDSNDAEHDALYNLLSAVAPEALERIGDADGECVRCGVGLVPEDFALGATVIPKVNGFVYCPDHDPSNPYNEGEV